MYSQITDVEFFIEKAKSNRGKCSICRKIINIGSDKVKVKEFQKSRSFHRECFIPQLKIELTQMYKIFCILNGNATTLNEHLKETIGLLEKPIVCKENCNEFEDKKCSNFPNCISEKVTDRLGNDVKLKFNEV